MTIRNVRQLQINDDNNYRFFVPIGCGCSSKVVQAVALWRSRKVGFIGLERDWEKIDVAVSQWLTSVASTWQVVAWFFIYLPPDVYLFLD